MAANDGGDGGVMLSVHRTVRELAAAMAQAGVESVQVELERDGAVVRMVYRLQVQEACEVCGEALPHDHPMGPLQAAAAARARQVATGMVH